MVDEVEKNKEEKNNDDKKVSSRTRVSLDKTIPDIRIRKIEDVQETIKAYSIASNQGKKPLKYTDFEGYVSFSIQYVSGLNKFLEYLGLIQRIKGKPGYYTPTSDLLEYQKHKNWNDEEGARNIMKDVLKDTWFFESAKNTIQMKGKATQEDLIQRFGLDSGASEQHEPALKLLVSYLVDMGLICEENDEYTLTTDIDIPTQHEEVINKLDETPPQHEEIPKHKSIQQKQKISGNLLSLPISININIPADANENQIDTIFRKIKEHFMNDESQEE
jgi:hypothetical protein